jgi:prepilin-type N-terminal cleavage/methylation domain-containing protein
MISREIFTKLFPKRLLQRPSMNAQFTNFEIKTAKNSRVHEAQSGRFKTRGFTLVEVMVATVLFAVIMLGMLTALVQSYRLTAEVRIRNDIRYVLRSMGDQFLVNSIPTTVMPVDLIATPPTPLFKYAAVPTGEGLSWRKDLNIFSVKPPASMSDVYINGTSGGLTVPLGKSSGTPVNVTFTRTLTRIATTPGGTSPSTSANKESAGFMLKADFSAQFSILGRQLTQSITVVRSVQ